MKYLKLMVLVIVTILTFGSPKADAQVIVRVGPGHYYYHHRYWHHRAPYFNRYHHRYYRYY
ncbi:hypothetical protein [Pedobacter sp. L105]|uniref:hypothetical protein n=1 Tax=Pedobacter sp. L105 TaxID=1641871 RepID=UPI00131DD5C0|nr:hypothetical protein [Pedobacter sp. L105]